MTHDRAAHEHCQPRAAFARLPPSAELKVSSAPKRKTSQAWSRVEHTHNVRHIANLHVGAAEGN